MSQKFKSHFRSKVGAAKKLRRVSTEGSQNYVNALRLVISISPSDSDESFFGNNILDESSSQEDNEDEDVFVGLMRALSPVRHRWSIHRFVVLECYIDESESKGAKDPAVCVAGYMAQGKTWARLKREWNKTLDKAPKRVECFHATDFAGQRKSRDGNFHGWTISQRAFFIKRLITIVRDHKLKEFGAGFHHSTCKQVMTGNRGHVHGSPTLIAAKLAIYNISAFAMYRRWKYAPSFFVEAGSKYFAALEEAHRSLRQIQDTEFRRFFSKSTIAEVPRSREYPQTQPADMLAFYCTQWVSRIAGYDPGREDQETYSRRYAELFLPRMPPELIALLPVRNFVEYHTPRTLDYNLKLLEGKVKRNSK